MYYTFSAKRVYRNFHALLKLPLDKIYRYTLQLTTEVSTEISMKYLST